MRYSGDWIDGAWRDVRNSPSGCLFVLFFFAINEENGFYDADWNSQGFSFDLPTLSIDGLGFMKLDLGLYRFIGFYLG